jgi:hypothetical protein
MQVSAILSKTVAIIPNPDKPVAAQRRSRFSGEPKKELITKARKDENTKREKINFVLSSFRVFVMKKIF